MLFLLKGLKTYVIDYLFVILLFLLVGGMADLAKTFYTMMELAFFDREWAKKMIKYDNGCSMDNISLGEVTSTETPDEKPEVTNLGCGVVSDISFLLIRLLPAIITMAIFSFLRKRKRLAQQCCHGRPAIPDSVNMLDEQRDRIGFLFAFGVTAFDVLNIFRGQKYADFGKTNPWVSVWVTALNVIIIVTMYLPMFTFISYANELVGSISAVAYCTTVMGLSSFVVCHERPNWWEASGSKSDVLVFVFSVCYLIRHIVVIVQLICGRRKRKNWNSSIFDELHHVVYVRALFRKKKEDAIGDSSKLEDTCLKRLLNAIKYRPVPGFRYSIRILATVIIAATVLYMVCVIELSYFENVRTWRQTIEEKVLNCLVDTDEYSAIALIWYDIVTYLEVILMTSCGVSAFIAVVFLIQTMTTYRNHMLRLYRGDKTFLPKPDGTPSSAMVSCFKYGGYQIGFLLWGFLCLQLTIALLIVFFLFELVFAKKFKWESYFLRQVPTMTSTGIFGALVYMFQLIVSKYVYLQDDGNVIGVDNRRHYHISAFSLLYYNVVLGVFTCISRLLRSLVVGLVFLGRLDHSVLPRNHENLDPGHRAYIGFLKVEEAHTHPVLVTFCHLLQFSRDFKPGTSLDGVFEIPMQSTQYKRTSRAKIRWFLAYTLIRNPILQVTRSHLLATRVGDTYGDGRAFWRRTTFS